MILDRRRQIIGSNAAAVRRLAAAGCLRIRGGQVVDFDGIGSMPLAIAVARGFAGQRVHVAVAVLDGPARGTWIVQVKPPSPREFWRPRDSVALELEPPPAAELAVAFMGRLFGLEPIEVAVLGELLGGSALDEAAARLSIKTSAVEAAVAGLMRKTVSVDRADVVAVTLCAAHLAAIDDGSP